MQRDPSLKRIPVIIVSARSMLADLRAGLSAGAVNYLTKPVAYAELIAAITRALEVKAAPLG